MIIRSGKFGKLILRGFKPEDAQLIIPRDEDKKMFNKVDNPAEVICSIVENGEAWTILKNDKLVTIMGTCPQFTGVTEIWQMPNAGMVRENPRTVKKIIHIIEQYLFETNWRLYTQCENDELHNRWMEFIGYTKEGIMKKNSVDGTDTVMWAKVR